VAEGALATAAVEIVAELERFEPELREKLLAATRRVARDTQREFDKAGARSGKAFADAAAKTAGANAAFQDLSRGAERFEQTAGRAARSAAKSFQLPQTEVQKLEQVVNRASDSQAEAIGRVRVAQQRLNELRADSRSKVSDVIAAEERLATAQRQSTRANQSLLQATESLLSARERLFAQSGERAGEAAGDGFGGGFRRAAARAADSGGYDAGGFFGRAFERAASRAVGTGLLRVFAAGIGSLAVAASPLSTVLSGGAAAVLALAGALAQASGAALSLGGVLGSLGLAAAALKVGTSGLGDAWKAQAAALEELRTEGEVSAATQEKLAAALKNLSPAAAATVRQLATMAPAWERVRRAVQQNLFEGVARSLQRLGATYLPILNTQLAAAARTLSRTGNGLAAFLTQGARAQQVSGIFTGLNRILATLLQPLQSITGGFLDLFTASLPFAQQLANVLSNIGTSFGEWLGRVADSEDFTRFMEQAMQTAGNLFQLLGNIGSIIGSVFGAGSDAGANLLVILRDLTGSFAQFLKSAEGQQALADFFGTIGEAGRVLVGIFTTLQPLLTGIGNLFAGLQGPLQQLGQALQPVIAAIAETLGTALSQLAPILGSLVTALAPVVTVIGSGLNSVLAALLPVVLSITSAFAQMVPVLAPLAQLLVTALVGAIQQIAPLFLQLVPILLQFNQAIAVGLQPVLAAIVPVFGQLVGAVVQVLAAAIQLLPALLPLIPPLAELALAGTQTALAFAPILLAFAELATVVLGQAAPALAKLVEFIIPVIDAFTEIATATTRVVSAIAQFVGRAIGLFTQFRRSGQSEFQAWRTVIIALVSGAATQIISFLGRMVSGAVAVLRGWIGQAASAVSGVVSAITGAITSGLSGLGSRLAQYGRDAVNGFVGGLQSALGRVRDVAGQIAGAVTGPVAKLLKIGSPSKVMRDRGRDTVQGYINGIREKIPQVRASLVGLATAVPDQVISAFGKARSAVNSLGSNLLTTQRQRLNQMFANAQTGLAALDRSGTQVEARLKAATDRLRDLQKEAQQFAASVAQSVLQSGSIVQGQDTSFAAIVGNLRDAVTNARQFQTVLAGLSRAGLNQAALRQIAEAGPTQGLAVGQSILRAGAAGIAQVNKLQGQLQTAANAAAKTAADALFSQGIKVAEGVVAGFQRQKSQLDLAMTKLADVLVARVVKLLRTTRVSAAGGISIPGFANGGLATRPSLVAEDYRPEVVIPLTKPKRRDQLLERYFPDHVGGRADAGRGGRVREINMPVTIAGLTKDETMQVFRQWLDSTFGPRLGLRTSGGVL
jgi:phage-related protein